MGLFIEFYLHIFPFSSVAFDGHTRRQMSLTAIAGVVLAAVQHFSNKYSVMYGIPASLSTSIGYYCPPGPHNVSTRTTFREMWQLFDKGLHLFLKNFIYIPIATSNWGPKWICSIIGSISAYFTVYYWHGATETCMWWAVTNWLGIITEQQVYRYSISSFHVSSSNRFIKDRLLILTKAIIFGALINTNLIYLFQVDSSYQIISRLYTESILFTLTAHFVLYCGIIAINTNHVD